MSLKIIKIIDKMIKDIPLYLVDLYVWGETNFK